MSPMSLNTFDAKTLQHLAQHQHQHSPQGERVERWFGQLAMAVVGLAVLGALML
jgi:hypothetical protein